MCKFLSGTLIREIFKKAPDVRIPLLQVNLKLYGTKVRKETVVSKQKNHFLQALSNSIDKCEQKLEKYFPKAIYMNRILRIGMKDLISDMSKYMEVKTKQQTLGANSLTSEELRLMYTMSKDLKKIIPVIVIGAIPFTFTFIIPLAYLYPKRILTSHFWTPKQKLDFMLSDYKERINHYKPLFNYMQAEIRNINNDALNLKCRYILEHAENGRKLRSIDIVSCLELFENFPYSLEVLKKEHMKELLAIHDMSLWLPFKKMALMERGTLIKRMDLAIEKEGVTKMSDESLRWALFFRGLNPTGMSRERMMTRLEEWLTFTKYIKKKKQMSLILHGPILLAYNYSTKHI